MRDVINISTICEHLPEGVTVQDTKGALVYANPAAAKLSGFDTAEEFLQASPKDLVGRFQIKDENGDPLGFEGLPGRAVLLTKKKAQAIIRFRTLNTTQDKWSLVKSVPLFDTNSIFTGVLNTFYDLTNLKQSEEMLRLLNDTSNSLWSVTSYEDRLKQLAQIAVPRMADWCFISMANVHGELVPLAVAHLDPRKVENVISFAKNASLRESTSGRAYHVFQTGKSEIYPHIDEEMLAKRVKNPTQLQFIQSLGIRSVVMVPIIASNRKLGVITFVYAESGRIYDSVDLTFIENMVQRASLLIENARLFGQAEEHIKKLTHVQKTLEEKTNTLQIALEVGRMGVWDWDIYTDHFTESAEYIGLFGSQKDAPMSLQALIRKVHIADRKRLKSSFTKALHKGSLMEEFRVDWADGSIHWIFQKGQTLYDHAHKAVRMVGIGMDITQRKISEEALRLSGNKFKSIFDTSLDAIVIVDNQMNIIDVNASALELFQNTKDELLSKSFIDLVSLEEKKKMKANWKKLRTHGSQLSEIDIVRPIGDARTIEYNANTQFLPNQYVFIIRDISERKEEEKRREHLLGIAGHELRTPIAGIKAFDEILKRHFSKLSDTKALMYLDKIDEKANTLTQLINDLLDITRIRQSRMEFYYELFDIDEFVEGIINDIALTINTHKIIKKGKIGKDIVSDKNRLSQVIINLIRNAVKYSPDAKKVIVKLVKQDKNILLSIQDFGVGIAKIDHKKIFNLFYRVNDRAQQRVYGLGLGLFIASQIVKKQGGTIWVESQKGKGSTFFVRLPFQPPNYLS